MRTGFLSYSHEAKEWHDVILHSLSAEVRRAIWVDTEIKPGEKWFDEIKEHIDRCEIGILLVTHEFVLSNLINEHELPELINKTQSEDRDFKLLVIPCEPFDAKALDERLFEYQWVLSPEDNLLEARDKGQALYKRKILEVATKIREVFNLPPSIKHHIHERSDTGTALHMLTGGKGGIGKTLMGLSVFLTYALRFNQSIHGLDLNSMNADLYRLLAFKRTKDVDPNWRTSEAQAGAHVSVPFDPHILPQGAAGFWKQVLVPFSNRDYDGYNYVIDTNLHIANLYSGNPSPDRYISQLIEKTSKPIYIWILWTYASVSEAHVVNKALKNFYSQFGERVRAIHVLNPGALMPPTYDIRREIDHMTTLREHERMYRKILQDPIALPQIVIDGLRQGLKAIEEETDLMFKQLPQNPKPALTQGLVELWELDSVPVDFSIYDNRLLKILNSELDRFEPKKFISLREQIEREFRGRPINVLPIRSHNTGFIGYTEKRNIGDNLGEIRELISSVYTDVEKFLTLLLQVEA